MLFRSGIKKFMLRCEFSWSTVKCIGTIIRGRENSVLISAVSRMMQGLGVPHFVDRVEKKWTDQRK